MKGKGLLFIIGLFLIFSLFIYWITADSPVEEAIIKIEATTNVDELKEVFTSLELDLRKDDDIRKASKEKIASFKLRNKQEKDLLNWFPALENAVNFLIVPDLSYRIKQYPDQPAIDKKLIDTLYACFTESIQSKKIRPARKEFLHDRLFVDVSDPGQASTVFKGIADSLMVELNQNRSVATRIWLENKRPYFRSNLEMLYDSAIKATRGTDYWDFFNRKLQDHEQKDNLDVRYRNVLIILTDGYLEAASGYHTSKIVQAGNTSLNQIPNCPEADLTNWEIYVLEGRERKTGDNQILRRAWYEWLSEMGADIDQREFYQFNKDQMNLTTRFIRKNIFGLE